MPRKRGPKKTPDSKIIAVRMMLADEAVSYADIKRTYKLSFATIARISTGELVPQCEVKESA